MQKRFKKRINRFPVTSENGAKDFVEVWQEFIRVYYLSGATEDVPAMKEICLSSTGEFLNWKSKGVYETVSYNPVTYTCLEEFFEFAE